MKHRQEGSLSRHFSGSQCEFNDRIGYKQNLAIPYVVLSPTAISQVPGISTSPESEIHLRLHQAKVYPSTADASLEQLSAQLASIPTGVSFVKLLFMAFPARTRACLVSTILCSSFLSLASFIISIFSLWCSPPSSLQEGIFQCAGKSYTTKGLRNDGKWFHREWSSAVFMFQSIKTKAVMGGIFTTVCGH